MCAAYTTLFSYLIQTVLLYKNAKKIYNQDIGDFSEVYDNKRIINMSIVVTVLLLSGVFLYNSNVIRFSIIGILFVVLCYFFGTNFKKIKSIKNRLTK